jgi:WD40 repeat protein
MGSTSKLVVRPGEAIDLETLKDASSFGSLRAIKFMADGDLAICAVRSTAPVQYLTRTPTGLLLTNPGKRYPSSRCTESFVHDGSVLQSGRDLLPVAMGSAAGASGKIVLSSYDDGTVRLQDLRSHAAFDTIYQDHFELVTPMDPLVSHGLERFIASSARNSILKIFDFRWNRSYSYIDAHPCSEKPMVPTPKSLTLAPLPVVARRDTCCHLSGYPCYLHALARTDFYKPNCNVYLPTINHAASPVYSLAKSSDLSSSVYAGLSGELSRMSLRDPLADLAEKSWMQQSDCKMRCGYVFCEGSVSIVESGDGIALDDISKSKRLPALYKQSLQGSGAVSRSHQRLDGLYY